MFIYHINLQNRWHQRNNACQWIVWSICEILLTWEPLFQLFTKQEVLPGFSQKPDFYSHLKGQLFHLSHAWTNNSFLSEQQHNHPENKPFHFQFDSTVLLFVVTFFWIIKNVYAREISKKFSKYSALVWVFIRVVNSDWSLCNIH